MPTAAALALALDLLGTLPSNTQVTPIVRQSYAIALDDLTDTALRGAVQRALAECRFRPTPAELRELAGCGNAEDAARALWDVVEGTMRRHGRYASVDFGPEANAAIRHIVDGPNAAWEQLCLGDASTLVHRRREFERAVVGYLRSGVPGERGAHLPGEYERVLGAAWDGEVKRLGPTSSAPALRIAAGGAR